jgi:hypothetical protein
MGVGYEKTTSDDYLKGGLRNLQLGLYYPTEAKMQSIMNAMIGDGLN